MKVSLKLNNYLHNKFWAGIAQSVWRIATGWTFGGSNPGGSENLQLSILSLGSIQPPLKWKPGLFWG
jgi:hypothetical protein